VLRSQLPGGTFKDVPKAHSKRMAAIRGYGNKTTEERLRLGLVRAGIRGWRLRPRDIQGHPDFFFSEVRLAIFVDGCFWHGCPSCGHVPQKNRSFWAAKLARNRERDSRTTKRLENEGYIVLRFWEHELRDSLSLCITKVIRVIETANQELSGRGSVSQRRDKW